MEAGDKRVRPPASRYPNGPSDNPKVPLRVVSNHEKFAGYGGGGRGYICTPLHRKLATPWQFIRPRSDITTHGAFLELVLLPSVSFSQPYPSTFVSLQIRAIIAHSLTRSPSCRRWRKTRKRPSRRASQPSRGRPTTVKMLASHSESPGVPQG